MRNQDFYYAFGEDYNENNDNKALTNFDDDLSDFDDAFFSTFDNDRFSFLEED